jgi:D-glucosaminate-specific PTS system IIC component
MLSVAILTGFLYFLGRSLIGYTLTNAFRQPVFMALPIGIVMGDDPTAMIIGGSIQLVYLGMLSAGAQLPADECFAGAIAIPIALKTGMSPEMAVTFAIPFGILGVFLNQLYMTSTATFFHMADRYAEECNTRGIWLCATVWPLLLRFALTFPPAFLANMYGPDVVTAFLDAIPEWLMHGFSVAGGVLPALGFALTMFVIGKKQFLPFFIIGFFAVQYLGLDIMATAIFGACTAVLIITFRNLKGGANA